MLSLYERKKTCSIFNVEAELEQCGINTRAPEYNLTDVFASDMEYMTPLDDHVEKVKFAATCRSLIPKLEALYQAAFRQDKDIVAQLEEVAYHAALGADTKSVLSLAQVLDLYMHELDRRREEYVEGAVSGMPTGFTDLDRMLGGLRKARLYTLAALTGIGKTAWALNIAIFIALHAKHVLFFSAEMEHDELAERILSALAEIPQEYLRDGNIDDTQYDYLALAKKRLSACHFEVDDSTHLLSEMRSKAHKVHAARPLDLIVVDYLQLLDYYAEGRAKGESRAEEVGKISRDLKRMARAFKVPVLALAQMNRESEKRENPLPRLSDLGDSSGIEKNSDAVIFLYVNPTEIEKREKSEVYRVNIIVKKQRHGRVGTVDLMFRPRLTRFENKSLPEVTLPYAD